MRATLVTMSHLPRNLDVRGSSVQALAWTNWCFTFVARARNSVVEPRRLTFARVVIVRWTPAPWCPPAAAAGSSFLVPT
eukprot:6796219-Prymnesium_polylepis.1